MKKGSKVHVQQYNLSVTGKQSKSQLNIGFFILNYSIKTLINPTVNAFLIEKITSYNEHLSELITKTQKNINPLKKLFYLPIK